MRDTLSEHLDDILNRTAKPHDPLFNPPQRDDSINYSLGVMLLRRYGIKLHLHRKGPYCLHFVEGCGSNDPTSLTETLFSRSDDDLIGFWEGLWTLEAKSRLRRHARLLLRREEALRANARWNGKEK